MQNNQQQVAQTHQMAVANKPLLTLSHIDKNFGGVKALTDVSLNVMPNTVHGLIGPNGAGKTTLFNIMTGMYQATSGEIAFVGQPLSLKTTPQKFAQMGIARTFQNIRLFANMTALENVMVGEHCHTKAGLLGAVLGLKKSRDEEKLIKTEALRLLNYVGLPTSAANRVANTLSYGDQRRLEIARALALKPKLLALDEPAAGMNPTETESLSELILALKNDGLTIVLIEHDVGLMMKLCDHITVLNFGIKIAEGTPNEVRHHPAVIEAYLGGAGTIDSNRSVAVIEETVTIETVVDNDIVIERLETITEMTVGEHK